MDKLIKVTEIVRAFLWVTSYFLWSFGFFVILFHSVLEKDYMSAFASQFLFAILTSGCVVVFYKDVILKKKQQTECKLNE
ncbi:hypothetical protein [Bacillus sp. TV3D]|uniref:hypothetical protein n=1 Tax=Bacillus sp. TV3D TaxID=3447562 RepID=UPI003ED98762